MNNLTPQGGVLLYVRMARLGASWAMDSRGKKISDDFLSNKRHMFSEMRALIRPLADAIAPLSLLIRPHPNEDHSPWHDAVAEVDNAHVAFDGSVVPWVIGAKALVHNNCTTAVEAAVAGTPVLNFRPWTSEFDNDLSHAIGQDCAHAADIAEALAGLVTTGGATLSAEQKTLLARHIASISDSLCSERIVDFLGSRGQAIQKAPQVGLFDRAKIAMGLRRIWLGRFLIRTLIGQPPGSVFSETTNRILDRTRRHA